MATPAPEPTSSPRPGAIRLPDPDAGPRRLLRLVLGALALMFALLALGWWGGYAERSPWLAFLLPFVPPLALVAYVVFHGPPHGRPIVVRRAPSAVLGVPGGALPADRGRIVVERRTRSTGRSRYYVYAVRYEGPDLARPLFRNGRDPSEVRACAEGLCRLGGYDMVWRGPDGDEIRSPSELDLPLVARLSAGRGRESAAAQPSRRARRSASGALELSSGHLGGGTLVQIFGLFWFLALAITLLEATNDGFSKSLLASAEGLATVAGVLVLLYDRLVGQTLEVSPAGLRLRTRIFGLAGPETFVPAPRLESLYVERRALYHRLVLAGDGFHHLAGRFDGLEQAVDARRQVTDALLGR